MTAIFLNGCTSAGKSSIARAFQATLPSPHCVLGIDDAFAMMPPNLHNHPDGTVFDRDEHGLVHLNLGEFGWRVVEAHIATAALLIRRGLDVILDEVVLTDRMAEVWREALAGLDVFHVTVRCSLAELERREVERGDRLIGQARGQFGHVPERICADLVVDTTSRSPVATAEAIGVAYGVWTAKSSSASGSA